MRELVSIKKIQAAEPAVWDRIWLECDYSTYYHSREWAEIWNIYTEGAMHPTPLLITFSDGLKALLPFSRSRETFVSSPAGTYGGWISSVSDPLQVKHAEQLNEYISRSSKFTWRLNPYDPLVFKAGVKGSRDDETYALSLKEEFGAVFKRWSHGHRSAARKAMREGLTVRIASTWSEWRAYYQVYEDSLRRWGSRATSRYGWEMFEEMFRRKSPHIRLWVADYRDTIVAGSLVLYSRTHAGAWHAAALEQYFHLRPAILLKYESIRHACEQRYMWFDFNPSGGHKSVMEFKKSFGTQVKSAPVVSK